MESHAKTVEKLTYLDGPLADCTVVVYMPNLLRMTKRIFPIQRHTVAYQYHQSKQSENAVMGILTLEPFLGIQRRRTLGEMS